MAQHLLNPVEGETWEHPNSRNQYRIHSVTDDGWTRYYSSHPSQPDHDCYPLWTQPTLKFIAIYRKALLNGA